MQPTDELYYKYAGVIDSVVQRYAYKFPDISEELALQAQYLFCKACLSYDPSHPSGASFETWLRRVLHKVTDIIADSATGPSLINDDGKSILNLSSIEKDSEDCIDGNMEFTIDSFADSGYLADYGYKLEDKCPEGYNKDMEQYIAALKGDALQVFKDYCDGKFDLDTPSYLSKARQKNRELLNPTKLYKRLYINQGWSLDRVRNAWRGVCGVLSNYMKGQLPVLLSSKKYALGSVQNEKRTWKETFKERYGISYNEYRRLRRCNKIPPVGACTLG